VSDEQTPRNGIEPAVLLARDPLSKTELYQYIDGTFFLLMPFSRGTPVYNARSSNTIIKGLASAGIMSQYEDRIYLRFGGRWHELSGAPAVRVMLSDILVCASLRDPSLDATKWWSANSNADTCADALIGNTNFAVCADIPHELASALCAIQDRKGVPKAEGVLRHPVNGEPQEVWLEDFSDVEVPEKTNYKHLKALYEGLELDEASHATLYSFVLAAFDAASLSCPRPILLVDSWQQGRGKSEVCGSVCRLIDNNDSAISARADSDNFDDQLVAAVAEARTITLDNVDGMRNYNLHKLTIGATGELRVRHKYSKKNTSHKGVIIMFNCVIGAATFHDDMLCRFARVELRGNNKRLTPAPKGYAQRYRKQIIAEILHALKHAEPSESPADSRFEVFESIGAAAYARVFDVEISEVFSRLEAAHRGAMFYHPSVFNHFACCNYSTLVYTNRRVLEHDFPSPAQAKQIRLPDRPDGACAFGKTLQDGEWK